MPFTKKIHGYSKMSAPLSLYSHPKRGKSVFSLFAQQKNSPHLNDHLFCNCRFSKDRTRERFPKDTLLATLTNISLGTVCHIFCFSQKDFMSATISFRLFLSFITNTTIAEFVFLQEA